MLLDDDVVADGEPKASAFSGRFRREEWIKHLLLNVSRNSGAVISNPYFNAVTEVVGRGNQNRLMVAFLRLHFALRRRVKAIRNKVEKRPRNLPRQQVDLAGGWIKRCLQLDRKAPLLGSCVVVGTIETFLHESIDIGGPMLAGTLARMQPHALDYRVRTFAGLHGFFEIATECIGQLFDLRLRF